MDLPKHAFFRGIIPSTHAKAGVVTHALNYETAVFVGMRGYWSEEQNFFVFDPMIIFDAFRFMPLDVQSI